MLQEEIQKSWDVNFISCADYFKHVNETLNNMYRKQNIKIYRNSIKVLSIQRK